MRMQVGGWTSIYVKRRYYILYVVDFDDYENVQLSEDEVRIRKAKRIMIFNEENDSSWSTRTVNIKAESAP